MTSERKIAAARANGARSRGPKTDAGKRRSSQNSRKHGLYARTPPGDSDIPEELALQFAAYWTEFQPQSPRAIAALNAKIEAELQLFLLARTETALWSAEYNRLAALHSGGDHCHTHSAANGGIGGYHRSKHSPRTMVSTSIHQNPGLNRGALYYDAMECTPARLIFRCYNRWQRRKARAEAILRDENEILKQRTEIAPPAVPAENAKTSERTNRVPRHAHRHHVEAGVPAVPACPRDQRSPAPKRNSSRTNQPPPPTQPPQPSLNSPPPGLAAATMTMPYSYIRNNEYSNADFAKALQSRVLPGTRSSHENCHR